MVAQCLFRNICVDSFLNIVFSTSTPMKLGFLGKFTFFSSSFFFYFMGSCDVPWIFLDPQGSEFCSTFSDPSLDHLTECHAIPHLISGLLGVSCLATSRHLTTHLLSWVSGYSSSSLSVGGLRRNLALCLLQRARSLCSGHPTQEVVYRVEDLETYRKRHILQ